MKVRWYMERGDISILKSWFKFNRVCVEFRRTSWNLHEFEMLAGWISDAVLWIWFGWSWNAILWTWLEVSRHQDGGETQTSGSEFSWETTQMEKRDKSKSLTGGEMQIVRLGWGEMGHGLSWDSHLETWIRCNVTTSRFNYHDLDWGETWPGLWWGVNIATGMDVARVTMRCEYL